VKCCLVRRLCPSTCFLGLFFCEFLKAAFVRDMLTLMIKESANDCLAPKFILSIITMILLWRARLKIRSSCWSEPNQA
jgi:hypothetical protein